MLDRQTNDDELLVPAGARLFHAGMPKTGTTALQRTAASRRDLLLAHGVRYPGTGTNHRKAMFAYSARPVGWAGPGGSVPNRTRWDRLASEIRSEGARRVWLSNENLSDEPEAMLRALLDDSGGPPVVALTLRSLPAQLASAWQQYLKSGVWITFETWLQRVIGDTPDPGTTPSFAARCAVGEVVEKWVRLVGKDNVVVVVIDPSDRTLVPRTFERLVGLPQQSLAEEVLDGHHANRSLSAPEAELLRRVNRVVRELGDVSWRDYERFVRNGAVEAMLARRTPGPDEARIVPPHWAVDKTVTLAQHQIQRISASGVRVVGILDHLAERVPSVDRARPPQTIPADAAAEALLAVLSTGLGRGTTFAAPTPPPTPTTTATSPRIEDMPSSTLARLLALRLRRRAHRQIRHAWPSAHRRSGQRQQPQETPTRTP